MYTFWGENWLNFFTHLILIKTLYTFKGGNWLKFRTLLHIILLFSIQTQNVLLPSMPLNQASLLMQSRKSEDDIDTIYELCTDLTAPQVLKLIKSYTADDCENTITPTFIEKLTKKLASKEGYVSTKNPSFHLLF